MWTCIHIYLHTYIHMYLTEFIAFYVFYMFYVTLCAHGAWWMYCRLVFNHVNTLQMCMAQKRGKWYIPGILAKDWTLLGASSLFLYSFIPFFYFIIYFYFYLKLRTFSSQWCRTCIHMYVSLYRVCVLWFYCTDWFYDFQIGQNWPQQKINQIILDNFKITNSGLQPHDAPGASGLIQRQKSPGKNDRHSLGFIND